ncbi:MAG: TraR/DksA family transcriptional regulator [Bradymonadaceae bacterium]|nr:TraR/DksA family transcriptional regulator [Lujinxingiaceae bacterium]
MEQDELEKLRGLLVERRLALLAEGDLKADPNRSHASTIPDEDEQPLNEMNQVISSRRNRLRKEEIAGIEAALGRMKADPEDFGLCQDCEEPIPKGRLEVMPWALYCVGCQSKRSGPKYGGRRRHAGDFDD